MQYRGKAGASERGQEWDIEDQVNEKYQWRQKKEEDDEDLDGGGGGGGGRAEGMSGGWILTDDADEEPGPDSCLERLLVEESLVLLPHINDATAAPKLIADQKRARQIRRCRWVDKHDVLLQNLSSSIFLPTLSLPHSPPPSPHPSSCIRPQNVFGCRCYM